MTVDETGIDETVVDKTGVDELGILHAVSIKSLLKTTEGRVW